MPKSLHRLKLAQRILLFCFVAVSSQAFASDYGMLSEIAATYAERASQNDTLRITWQGETTMMNGDEYGRFPENKMSMVNNGRLVLQGASSRLEFEQESWSPVTREISERRLMIHVYHDGKSKTHVPGDKRGHQSEGRNDAFHFLKQNVMTMSYRPDPPFLTDESIEVLRRETTGQGEMLVLGNTDYNDTTRGGSTRKEYFLDPSRGFILTKMLLQLPNGTVTNELEVEYVLVDEVGLIPESLTHTSWGFTEARSKVVKSVSTLRITSVDLNHPAEASEFQYMFPTGTAVYDNTLRLEFVVGKDSRIEFGNANPGIEHFPTEHQSNVPIQPDAAFTP